MQRVNLLDITQQQEYYDSHAILALVSYNFNTLAHFLWRIEYVYFLERQGYKKYAIGNYLAPYLTRHIGPGAG